MTVILPSFKITDVERNLSVLSELLEHTNCHIKPVGLLKAGHTLAWWINSQGLGDSFRWLDDITKIAPFWELCKEYGFSFSPAERQELFEHYHDYG